MAPVSMVGPKTPKSGHLNNNDDANQNIQVFVRCRPLKPTEKKNVVDVVPERKEVRVNERNLSLINEKLTTKTFTFDNAFGPETPQIDVYLSVVSPLIDQVVLGYNCTVFAYGQTGTGKTYTMEGERTTEDVVCSWEKDPLCGIIPRALHQLFETLQTQNAEHTVRVSFLELYNEELYDLLSAIDDTTKLKIYEDSTRKGSTIVGNLEEITVHTKAEIYDILRKGSAKRQTAATLLNACSSRSHTIFSVTVHIKENSIEGEELVKIGKLNLVDLAGSENIGRSGAIDKRAREAGNINQSLLTLGRVITSLVEKAPHIPYRESKLTRLLQDSLGGRTKTSIIATISPNIADVEDTLSTLDYAHRAKKITNKPEINQKLSKKTLLREYTAEIERLRRDLAACREKTGFFVNEENYNQMVEQIKLQSEDIEERVAKIQALQAEVEKWTNLFEETKQELEVKTKDLEVTTTNLHKTSQELVKTQNNLEEKTVECQEQKHLVDVHVENEKVLSGQAKKLLEVADETTSHVELLHQKVERQQNVEATNSYKIEDFQKNFQSEMKSLEEWIGSAASEYQDEVKSMSSQIRTKFDLYQQEIDKSSVNLANFGSDFIKKYEEIKNLFKKDGDILEKANEMKSQNVELNEKVEMNEKLLFTGLETLQSFLHNEIGKIISVIAKQRTEIENLIMKQNSKLNELIEIRQTCFEDVKTNLIEIRNKETQFLNNEIQRIQNYLSTRNELINKQLAQSEELMKSNIQLINQLREQEANNFMEFNEESKNNNEKFVELSQSNSKKSTVEMEEADKKIKLVEKTVLENVEKVDSLSMSNTQKAINSCQDTQMKTDELIGQLKEKSESGNIEVKNGIGKMRQINDNVICDVAKQITDRQDTVNKIKDLVTLQVNEGGESFGVLKSEINKTVGIINEKEESIVHMTTAMEQSQQRQIDNLSSGFERFVKYELAKVIPTGTTPQKTEYSYPRNLIETSPHERILTRYRGAFDPSKAAAIPLPEEVDSEFLSERSDSNLSINSVGSSNANNENIPIEELGKKTSPKKISKSKSGSELRKKLDVDSTFTVDKKGLTKPKQIAMPLKATNNK